MVLFFSELHQTISSKVEIGADASSLFFLVFAVLLLLNERLQKDTFAQIPRVMKFLVADLEKPSENEIASTRNRNKRIGNEQ